jgi:hypothetical protein
MNYERICGEKDDVIGHPSGSLKEGRDYYFIVLIWTN